MTDEEYQAEYDKAAAELEAAANPTTPRGPDGKFAKAEPEKVEPEKTPDPVKEEAKVPAEEPEKPDPIKALEERVAKAEKIAKDNQAWATRLAQERAQEKREREAADRAANKPAILDANPGLDEAIRHVVNDPVEREQEVDKKAQWTAIVEKAHPGIFQLSDDDELVKALVAKRSEEWQDPLVAIREITAEKLAHAERQVGKRFAAEAAKLAQKSAMSVPGAGGGSGVMAPVDKQLEEVQRIQKMSDTEFAAEVRRVKGY